MWFSLGDVGLLGDGVIQVKTNFWYALNHVIWKYESKKKKKCVEQ